MFMENSEERRMREMREIEMMMEQARFRAAMQKINEQRSGQNSSSGGVGGGKKPPTSPPTPPQPTTASDWVIYLNGFYKLRAYSVSTQEVVDWGSALPDPTGGSNTCLSVRENSPGVSQIAVASWNGSAVEVYRGITDGVLTLWDPLYVLDPDPAVTGTLAFQGMAYAGETLYMLFSNKGATDVRLGTADFLTQRVLIPTNVPAWPAAGPLYNIGEGGANNVLLGSKISSGFSSLASNWQAFTPSPPAYDTVFDNLSDPAGSGVEKFSRRPGPLLHYFGFYYGQTSIAPNPWLIDSTGTEVSSFPELVDSPVDSAAYCWAPPGWVPTPFLPEA